jgi:hypothetical protein
MAAEDGVFTAKVECAIELQSVSIDLGGGFQRVTIRGRILPLGRHTPSPSGVEIFTSMSATDPRIRSIVAEAKAAFTEYLTGVKLSGDDKP